MTTDRSDIDSIYIQSAQRLLKLHGYEEAKRRLTRWRDDNAFGTFTYASHNATLKALELLHAEQRDD